ncbi:MAG: ImmA/IrrE family metallo-endopeptidase [Solobacterium sp.]|nr:ImmA/IrrE family metallo-endopeptidase [Solobacterium sp.]
MNQNIDDIMRDLEQGVAAVFESDAYRDYLASLARFHNYSLNNSLLIFRQKPEATLVAAYGTWRKDFQRSVRRGEKAIRIIAPVFRRRDEEDERTEGRVIGYRAVPVFDISQTEGKPLTAGIIRTPLDTQPPASFLDALLLIAPVPVRFEETPGGVNGFYRPIAGDIVISREMEPVMQVKTLLHEITHAFLHAADDDESKVARMRREVEAESVAFAVSRYYGMDTSSYSLGYIAGWSSTKEMPELKNSLAVIHSTTGAIIQKLALVDPALQ